MSTKIVTSEVSNENENQNQNEKIFLICHRCLWNVTFLNKLYMQKVLGTSNLCPNCNQDQLSSLPLKTDDYFYTIIFKNEYLKSVTKIKHEYSRQYHT
jgi:hypothetical protein